MSRLFSSLQRLERTSAVITAYPFSWACWVYDDGTSTSFPFLLSLTTSGTTAAGTRISLNMDNTGKVSNGGTTTTTRSVNTWFHACGTWSATGVGSAYLNGGGKGTSGTSTFPTGMNRTSINAWNGGANVGIAGNIAHPTIWNNVTLADAEVLELAAGLIPTRMRPQSIIAYWACDGRDSGELDPYGRNDMTNYSSTVNANVPQISQASFIA